jgi:polysaccharide biosynthesis protein PslG
MLPRALLLLLATLPLSASQEKRPAESPFGVLDFLPWDHDWNRHHYPQAKVEQSAALMKEAGIGWARMDFLWNDLEPQKGRFEFARYDAIVGALAKNGVAILGILCYTAAWSNPKWNAAPDRAAFVAYARETVRHFKDRVRHWEVWNEPDVATYWEPQDQMKSYSALLKEVAAAARKEDPGCRVLLGGLAEPAGPALDRIYREAGKDAFDVVSIHPFIDPLRPDAIGALKEVLEKVRKTMEAHGDGAKDLWLTEIGCPGMKNPAAAAAWWLGRNTTEEEQARWVKAVLGEPLRWPGVKKVFWAFFRDTPRHFHNGVDSFGLLREDFSKKPAFDAYREAAAAKKP